MSPDLLIATGSGFLMVNTLLMLRNPRTCIDPIVSAATAFALALVSLGLFMLSAPVSGTLAAIAVMAWLGIHVLRR